MTTIDQIPTGALAAGAAFNAGMVYLAWGRKGFWWKAWLVINVLSLGVNATTAAGRVWK